MPGSVLAWTDGSRSRDPGGGEVGVYREVAWGVEGDLEGGGGYSVYECR